MAISHMRDCVEKMGEHGNQVVPRLSIHRNTGAKALEFRSELSR
jgi:hypothetical protein